MAGMLTAPGGEGGSGKPNTPANQPANNRQPTHRYRGSYQNQQIIDRFPSLAAIKADAEFQSMAPDQQQQYLSLFHQVVTRNSTAYKNANPDRRAIMDAAMQRDISGGDISQLVTQARQNRGMTPQPSYTRATTPGEQFMSGVSQSPTGYGVSLFTGQPMAERVEAENLGDHALQGLGMIGGTLLPAFGAAAGGAALAGGLGAGALMTGMAGGLAGGAATGGLNAAGKVRLGEIEADQALGEFATDTLIGGVAGAFTPLRAFRGTGGASEFGNTLLRNALQTGAGGLGETAKGNQVTPGSLLQDFALGVGIDVGSNVRGGVRGKGDFKVEGHSGSLDDVAAPMRGDQSKLLLPPGETRGVPVGDPYGPPPPSRPDPEFGGLLPDGNRLLPEAQTIFAGPAPKPEVTNQTRIADLQQEIARMDVAIGRVRNPDRRAKYEQRKMDLMDEARFLMDQETRGRAPQEQVPGEYSLIPRNQVQRKPVSREIDPENYEFPSNTPKQRSGLPYPDDEVWFTGQGRFSSLIDAANSKGSLYLTKDPIFAKGYGRVFEIKIPDKGKVFDTSDASQVEAVVDSMFDDHKNSRLNHGDLSEVVERSIDEHGIENAKRVWERELAPAEIQNESSYDSAGLQEWLYDRHGFDMVTFEDGDTALDLNPHRHFTLPMPDAVQLDDGPDIRYMNVGVTPKDLLRGAEVGAKGVGVVSRGIDAAAIKSLNWLGHRFGVGDLVDQSGAIIASREAADRIEKYLRTKKQNALADKLSAGLVDKYALPDDYLGARQQMDMTRNTIAQQFMRAADEHLRNLPPREQQLVYNILTDENMPPGTYQSLRADLRQLVDDMGERAVQAGVISREAFERNKGQYLARSYSEHELADKLGGVVKRVAKVTKWATGQLKRRGTTADLAESTFQRLQPSGQHPKTGNDMYSIGDHDWEYVGTVGGRAQFRRDWTKQERVDMGEIEDATYAFLKTGAQLSRNISTGEFYQQLANMPTIARKPVSDLEAQQLAAQGWVEVSGKIQGTTNARWGALDGHYVQPDVHRDLVEIQKLQDTSFARQLMTQWKLNKTARNPVVHFNNVMSNFALLELNGGNVDDVFTAARIMSGKANPQEAALLERAKELGVFGQSAIDRDMMDLLRGISPVTQGMTLPEKAWHFVKGLDEKMMSVYQQEDEVFRFALFKDMVAKNLPVEEAAQKAIAGFIDYNITAPTINTARRSVLPFIAYAYRATPLIARGLIERPWKAAKIVLALELANTIGSAFAGGNEGEERAAMEGVTRNAWTHLRTPWKDEFGQQRYLDATRYIPGFELFGGAAKAVMDQNLDPLVEGAANTIALGGPLVMGIDYWRNRDSFTGDPIHNENTPWTRQAMDTANWAYQQMAPNAPWMPGSYSQDKIIRAATGTPDKFGNRDSLPWAAASTLGPKTRPIVPEELHERRARKLRRDIQAAENVLRQAAIQRGNGSMSEGAFEQIRKEQMSVIEKAQTRFAAYQNRVAKAKGQPLTADQ